MSCNRLQPNKTFRPEIKQIQIVFSLPDMFLFQIFGSHSMFWLNARYDNFLSCSEKWAILYFHPLLINVFCYFSVKYQYWVLKGLTVWHHQCLQTSLVKILMQLLFYVNLIVLRLQFLASLPFHPMLINVFCYFSVTYQYWERL